MTNAKRLERIERRQNQTASESCADERGDIARLLDVLQMELDKHGERAQADPQNWGFAGDLATIRRGMINIVAGISSMDPADVENFLDDAV